MLQGAAKATSFKGVLELLTRRPATALLILMAAIILAQVLAKHRPEPGNADSASVMVARVLYATATGSQIAPSKQRQMRSPGYPLVLTAMAYVDPGVARGLACVGKPEGCTQGSPFLSLVVAQALAAVLALLLIYRLAWRLSHSQEIALITLVLAFIFGRFFDYAGNLFGHTWYQLGVVASLYLLVPSGSQLTLPRSLAAGLVIGLTALFEPTFIVVAPVAALLVVYTSRSRSLGVQAATAVLAGCALTVLIMLTLANALGYDLQAIARQMSWNLAERVAFNRLEGAAWWAGILLPIPVLGPIFGLFFPAEIIDSFGYYKPGTYVFEGANHILPETLAQPGGAWDQLSWLARTHVLGDMSAYLSSVPPMLVRGLWGGAGLIALVGLFQAPTLLRWARIGPRYGAALLIVVASSALLVANALVTSNPVYLNPMLVFLFAYTIAYVAGGR